MAYRRPALEAMERRRPLQVCYPPLGSWLRPLVGGLEVDLFGECERVVHLDAEAAYGALQLTVAEQELAGEWWRRSMEACHAGKPRRALA